MKPGKIIALTMAIFTLQAATAQSTLPAVATAPVLNGETSSGEYPFSKQIGGISFSAGKAADGKSLYLAASAKTQGWIAVGLGAPGMNLSRIFMGFDSNGKASFETHRGIGRGHGQEQTDDVIGWAVKEKDGITTMEFQVLAKDFADAKLPVILASGPRDDFTSKHRERGVTVLTLR